MGRLNAKFVLRVFETLVVFMSTILSRHLNARYVTVATDYYLYQVII